MAENSKIEWTDATVNPWWGCTKVSPGCAHCYADTLAHRWGKDVWGPGKPREDHRAGARKLALKLNREAESQKFMQCSLCGWRGVSKDKQEGGVFAGMLACPECNAHEGHLRIVRPRVFCSSMADWLDAEVPIEWLADLLALIRATPNLIWMLLTKRPENWKERLVKAAGAALTPVAGGALSNSVSEWIDEWRLGTPPANVWLGATVENQEMAERRLPQLLAIPARVRFLSCEPLLGPVDLVAAYNVGAPGRWTDNRTKIGADWVICGGESGAGARPMHPDWARSLRDQCAAAGVPFFFKQWGEWIPGEEHDVTEWRFQNDLRFDPHWFPDFNEKPTGWEVNYESGVIWKRLGKKAAGRLLDGVEHSAFPEVK